MAYLTPLDALQGMTGLIIAAEDTTLVSITTQYAAPSEEFWTHQKKFFKPFTALG
jgi:hypothetical protein